MIQPKFRELMLAEQTNRWKLRFRFNLGAETYASETATEQRKVVMTIADLLSSSPFAHSYNDAEKIVLENLKPEHGCAAYEILFTGDHCGIVGYLEWP